ncbi:MAG: hypothetical protein ACFFCW_47465 [Candidatus Hodarchaeota archaeon]
MAADEIAREKISQTREIRHLHLGVDYGTSYSKLIFRDYGAVGGEKSFIVRQNPSLMNSDFRFPSIVSLKNGKLYFGKQAERMVKQQDVMSYYSLKARFAFPEDFYQEPTALPFDLTVQDLIVLSIVYLLVMGFGWAKVYARRNGFDPILGMTLGVPMSYMDNIQLREQFSRIARKAYLLWKRLGTERLLDLYKNGMSVHSAKQLVKFAKMKDRGLPPPDYKSWIREEVSAAMIWSFNSPRIEEGLYAAFDIGAATTNASFFRIQSEHNDGEQRWIKTRLGFYGAVAETPGVDAYDKELAACLDNKRVVDIRENENALLNSLGPEQRARLREVADKIMNNCKHAFHRSYRKEPVQSRWEKYPLILLGGGSLVNGIREKLRIHVHHYSWGNPEIVDPGWPTDLRELDGRDATGQSEFLLVAYGLSYISADVPEVKGPEDIGPFRLEPPPVNFVPHEEIYAK